jgi:hypothetical protein
MPEAVGRHLAALMERIEAMKPTHLMDGPERDAREAEQRAKERLAARRRRLHDSGIVRAIQHPGADLPQIIHGQLRETAALAIVRTWWAEGDPVRPWLILGGTTGVGKTWAAAWAIADQPGSRYVTARQLIRASLSVREARGPMQVASAEAAWRPLTECPLLVLDELGQPDERNPDPWPMTREPLHAIVEERGAKPTLVLSNVASADLAAAWKRGALDPRTGSRLAPLVLRDAHKRPWWDVTGDDLRGTL